MKMKCLRGFLQPFFHADAWNAFSGCVDVSQP